MTAKKKPTKTPAKRFGREVTFSKRGIVRAPLNYAAIVRAHCLQHRFPLPVEEYRFSPSRKYRLDFAWPWQKLGLEVDGGVYRPSMGHSSVSGILRDMAKGNELARCGWRLVRVTPAQLSDAATWQLINDCLMGEDL